MSKDNISNYNLTDRAYNMVINEVLPNIKAFASENEKFMGIIKDFWSLPESIQKDICTKLLIEFLENKPISIGRFENIIKETVEYCNEHNIDLNKLKIEEDRKRKEESEIFDKAVYLASLQDEKLKEYEAKRREQINCMTPEEKAIYFYDIGSEPATQEQVDILLKIGKIDTQTYEKLSKNVKENNCSVLDAMRKSAEKLKSHPKYNFDGVRFEDDESDIKPTHLTNEGPIRSRSSENFNNN